MKTIALNDEFANMLKLLDCVYVQPCKVFMDHLQQRHASLHTEYEENEFASMQRNFQMITSQLQMLENYLEGDTVKN